MNRIFYELENVIKNNKKCSFEEYINEYKKVKKWVICSDYCIGDRNKSNDVITFTLFPYVCDFEELQNGIKKIAKTDIKKTRNITKEFCEFYHSGLTYSFNFILGKKSFIESILNKESMQKYLTEYIKMIDGLIKDNPEEEYYKQYKTILEGALNESKRKTFNFKLLRRIIIVTFIASYISYIIRREIELEIIGWFSDVDKITTSYNGISGILYTIQTYCLCTDKIDENYKSFQLAYGKDKEGKIFFDDMNRVADYLCGYLSDFNIEKKGVKKDKFCKIAEEVVADNKYISIYKFSDKGIQTIIQRRDKKSLNLFRL